MFKPLLIAGLLIALSAVPGAQARTLTAADGRVIEAEVVGFEGVEKVVIKRTDTGQTFTLPVDSFSETDRAALVKEAKAEAAKPPPPPAAGEVDLELARKAASGNPVVTPVYSIRTGDRERVGSITVTPVDASYAITLVNRARRPFDKLRMEYVLFAERTPRGGIRNKVLYRKAGSMDLPVLPAGERVVVNTVGIPARKADLDGSAYWGESNLPVDLKGIWLKIYQGDTLVMEEASPTNLATDQPWKAPDATLDSAPARRTR